jgi:two-component system, cell cycle sensor histidine kinase and response regulator CckA
MISPVLNEPPQTGISQRRTLRALLVEDAEFDAELLLRYLKSHGYDTHHRRVWSRATMEDALQSETWDLVLCDYQLPEFSVLSALVLLRNRKLDVPLIVVSGAIGEELAVDLMKAGASDFIVKGSLSRLIPAIERELREVQVRRAGAAALEKLSYLAAIVDSAEEAIIGQTLLGVITTWNSGAARLYGYAATEAIGRSASIIVPPELHDETVQLLSKLARGEGSIQLETTRLRKDGTRVEIFLALSAIKDGTGKIVGASSIAYDVTERKRMEAERTLLIEHLNGMLAKVKALSGLLRICASCKKIRDDHGAWQQLETYMKEHSEAEFSHSICPDCMQRLYPQFAPTTGGDDAKSN